jgi:hypothetical protein
MMAVVDRKSLELEVAGAITKAGVFDSHEHLVSFSQRAEKAPDLFDWIQSSYLWGDLVSAGMDGEILGNKQIRIEDRWAAVEPFLPTIRHTGYMEVCRHAWRDLCGMAGLYLDATNWRTVNAAIQAHNRSEHFGRDVLVDRCGMRQVLIDYQVGGTAGYFSAQREETDWYRYLLNVRPHKSDDFIARHTLVRHLDLPCQRKVAKIDSLCYGWLPQTGAENSALFGIDCGRAKTLEAWAELIHEAVRVCARSGVVGLKSALACCRSPNISMVDHKAAEAALRRPLGSLTPQDIMAFENFAFHEIARNAAQYQLPFQIHTGTTYGPRGAGSARDGAADRFSAIVRQYPETTFVLMHASWPYWGEIEQMAKRYSNVFLDLSWSIMLSPLEAQRMLGSMLTAVPINKLLWGGDCCYVEETYGAFVQFQRVLAEALADLIARGLITVEDAIEISTRVFCGNGVWIYPIG